MENISDKTYVYIQILVDDNNRDQFMDRKNDSSF